MNSLIHFLIFSIVIIYAVDCHQNHQNGPNGRAGQNINGHSEHDIAKDQIKTNINQELEHLDGVINKPKDQMTNEEQNFYYFKLHDYDNNNKLDGLELVSAFAHNEGNFKYYFF
jgi:hypothetical protein